MEEKIYKEILMNSPFGYACHKVLYGRQGEPEDYIFLEVNPAFEEMTGLKSEAILGKRVTECCRREDIIARWGGDEPSTSWLFS